MSEKITIVQVHLGAEVPRHLYIQIGQTRLLNPDAPIYLILSRGAAYDKGELNRLGVLVVTKESISVCDNHRRFLRRSKLNKRFWGGFWMYTSERFFAMESFLRALALHDIVHMENDVMLYTRLDELRPAFLKCCPRIGVTMDSENRCTPGILFMKDVEALSAMNSFIAGGPLQKRMSDMDAIGAYMRDSKPGVCSALPVVPPRYRELYPPVNAKGEAGPSRWYYEAFADFGGVFDAAALGQYLGGVDKRNDAGDTRGFVNETAVYDPRNMGIHWKSSDGLRLPFGSVGGAEFPIFNLHIHSKQLEEFSSSSSVPRG
jgi:hypothetical protein